jgi:hypothetical protein
LVVIGGSGDIGPLKSIEFLNWPNKDSWKYIANIELPSAMAVSKNAIIKRLVFF